MPCLLLQLKHGLCFFFLGYHIGKGNIFIIESTRGVCRKKLLYTFKTIERKLEKLSKPIPARKVKNQNNKMKLYVKTLL